MPMFHGRGVRRVERKTRLTEAERRRRRKIVTVVTIASGASFYAAALLWAAFEELGVERIGLLTTWLADNPFPFPWLDDETLLGCACWGCAAMLVPWVYYSSWLRKQGNFDPGAEHGDSRLAQPDDFADVKDAELPSNNIRLTTNAWLAMDPREGLDVNLNGLNHNILVIGTSGGGKTSTYSKPLIASSLGTRLCPGGVGPSGIADPGFDIVFTDTKGDVLPDVGHALVNSGADVRCFNIRDTRSSDRFNPFHAVGIEKRDAVEPSGKSIEITLEVDGRLAEIGAAGSGKDPRRLGLVVDGPTEFATGIGSPSEAESHDPWVCTSCGFVNPAEEPFCENPECEGCRPEQERPSLVAFLEAASYSGAGGSGIGMRIRLRNGTDDQGAAPVEVRLEARFPRGISLSGANVPGTDEQIGELLLNPEGDPVFRWDASIPPGETLSADVNAVVEKLNEISGSMLTRICECIVSNLDKSAAASQSEGAFWTTCASVTYKATSGLLLECWGKEFCTLPRVMDLILSMEVDPQDTSKDAVDILMDAWETGFMPAPPSDDPFATSMTDTVPCDVRDMSPIEVLEDGYWRLAPGQRWMGPHDRGEDTALSAFHTYRIGAVETRQSVLITAAATLSPIMSPEMRDLLSEDTLNLEALGSGEGHHALSIISHDTDKTFKPLIALVFYMTVLVLDENATKRPGTSLPRPVHILADEFKNLGKLPEIDGALSTVRSKNVSISMCVQSIDQLDSVYGEHTAAELRDNCATVVFMGGNNEKTLKSFETLSGTETVDMIQTSQSFGTSGQTTESRQVVQRPVVSVGQLRTCGNSYAYVLMANKYAFKDRKIGWGAYDFYEWFDPMRKDRHFSKGARKFTELFDFARYKADRDAGRTPYDYDESFKGMPAKWVSADEGKDA